MAQAKVAERPKTTQAAEPKVGQAVAQKGSNPVGPTRAERMQADAGKGVSQDRDDKLVPMVRVLQSQSPQCLKAKPEYIKDSEAGDFYLKNALVPIIKGEDGFIFQPCAFLKCWLEFDGPRDASPNFVRRHEDARGRPAGVEGLTLDEDDGYDFVDKDKHRYSFSREHYGLLEGKPYVFPFGGSGHTTSREWQTLMDQFVLKDGRPEPSFNRKYRITTTPKSNKSGDWYGVRIEHIGEVTDEEYDRGRALYDAVMGGAKVAEAPDKEGGGGGNADATKAGI